MKRNGLYEEENALVVCGGTTEDGENESFWDECVWDDTFTVSEFVDSLETLMKKYYAAAVLAGEDAIRICFRNGQIFWLYIKEFTDLEKTE